MQWPKETEERQKWSTKYNFSFIQQNLKKTQYVTGPYLLLQKTFGKQKTVMQNEDLSIIYRELRR